MSSTRWGPAVVAAALLVAACTGGSGATVGSSDDIGLDTTSTSAAGGPAEAPEDSTISTATPATPDGDDAPPADDGPDDGTSAPSSPDELAALTDAEAAALLTTFDGIDLEAVSTLAEHRHEPAVLAASRRLLDDGASGPARWAALYVWVNGGDDDGPLLALIADPDPGIRAMAATGLVARGRVEGFEPLVALLVDETVTTSWPPSVAWQDAALALVRFTGVSANGPPFDATPSQRAAAQERWTAWLATHRDGLTFDPTIALWIAP